MVHLTAFIMSLIFTTQICSRNAHPFFVQQRNSEFSSTNDQTPISLTSLHIPIIVVPDQQQGSHSLDQLDKFNEIYNDEEVNSGTALSYPGRNFPVAFSQDGNHHLKGAARFEEDFRRVRRSPQDNVDYFNLTEPEYYMSQNPIF